MKTLSFCLFLTLVGCSATKQEATSSATVFEGARLITGDGSAPIEDSAFVMENTKITAVGRKGDISTPASAAHVDLTGKTVMPALVDTHTHLGWAVIKTGRIDKDSYSKDNLIDHLHRLAYYGVAATQSMGIDPGETPYEVRANSVPDAALFHTAGRGMGRPNAGPCNRTGSRWLTRSIPKPTAGRPCRNSPARKSTGLRSGWMIATAPFPS
jgi:hypothetical protein